MWRPIPLLGSPRPRALRGPSETQHHESAESRSGHAAPGEQSLQGCGLREHAQACRAAGARPVGCRGLQGAGPRGAAGARPGCGVGARVAPHSRRGLPRRPRPTLPGAKTRQVPATDVTTARRPGSPFPAH